MPTATRKFTPTRQTNANTFVIHNTAGGCRFLNGFDGDDYEWTHDPRVCWGFADRGACIQRAAFVAKHGHHVQIITRKEALLLVGRPDEANQE